MIYITGDIHGDVSRLVDFYNASPEKFTKDDMVIVLGDAGINYYGGILDTVKKEKLKRLPFTIFCIHGNHEMRPKHISTYNLKMFKGGQVYVEDEYPNILFAKDGEIFDFDGIKTIVIGGAYSVDKHLRLALGGNWFADEQPSMYTKIKTEKNLDSVNWKVDLVLTHTCPLSYEPVEVFLDGIDQSTVDKTTENWLDEIEDQLMYKKWYCGHFHTEKIVDNLQFMFESIEELKV